MNRIVIVGASVAGLRAADVLRLSGFDGSLTIVDADRHVPYDKPPLSKRILTGQQDLEQIQLRRPDALAALSADLRLSTRATALDLADKRISLQHADGSFDQIAFDGLIIATGSSARTVPAWQAFEGVQTLRTMDDAVALKALLDAGPRRVVIIGAGFIGLEVASSCRQMGIDVTVVEPLPAPVVRGVGEEIGQIVGGFHRGQGVDLRLGIGVSELRGGRQVEQVVLTDGTVLDADVVLVGIGGAPNVSWLEGSGLELGDGLICDATLRAAPGVYAAGDVARWPHRLLGEQLRIEYWTTASEHGQSAAENLLAEAAGATGKAVGEVPFFWSDQFGGRIQVLGRSAPGDDVQIVRGSAEETKLLAFYSRGERLTAVLGVSLPRYLMPYKALLERSISLAEALEFAASQ
ncbi:MAG: NAD(P)/FAD-dependent oxidoreductase [Acidimicrobiia bacterium]